MSRPQRFFSLVKARYEDGGKTGVCRFDSEIRKVFPGLQSITAAPSDLDADDVVIADNHMTLQVPRVVRTFGVHHGCAKTHWDRDPAWRTPGTQRLVDDQAAMFQLPNRYWVAMSRWVRDQFAVANGLSQDYATVIPLWVPTFGPAPRWQKVKPVVIGDWRDSNKGAGMVERLRQACPEIEWRPLSFQPGQHRPFYMEADLYLCLSASEGSPYSVADAEACSLPIVTTDVGMVREYRDSLVIPWQHRENVDAVIDAVKTKLRTGRIHPSFYASYSEERWASSWRELVNAAFDVPRESYVRISPTAWRPGRRMKSEATVCVGLAGGVGNSIFNLPLLAALNHLGHRVIGYVNTDYKTSELWARCRYLDQIVHAGDPVPDADIYLAGPWCPKPMVHDKRVLRYLWKREPDYPEPEWSLIFKAARDLGWAGPPPDVSDWCRDLDRTKRFDVGIAPGCKPQDLWARKRYPGMAEVARRLVEAGLRVAIFGTEDDRVAMPIQGEDLLGKYEIGQLPDALASCRAVVGTDSGVTQLAASIGVPTVVVYTATSTVKGAPVGSSFTQLSAGKPCSPCQATPRWHACRDWVCQDVDPDAVVHAALSHLVRRGT